MVEDYNHLNMYARHTRTGDYCLAPKYMEVSLLEKTNSSQIPVPAKQRAQGVHVARAAQDQGLVLQLLAQLLENELEHRPVPLLPDARQDRVESDVEAALDQLNALHRRRLFVLP